MPHAKGPCRGGAETVQSGTWVGRIEFKGEQGYTAAHATRAKGAITDSPKVTCGGSEGKEGVFPDFQATVLSAASDARVILATSISSETRPDFSGSGFIASIVEFHRRGLSIIRSINANAKSEAIALSEESGHIVSAAISPPAPFKGTATFQRTSGSEGSWTGTLMGDFPGRGDVTLAGPKFSAKVSRMSG